MTVAFGDSSEMQKAIEMLGSVKDSIINAYEIKTGLSRAKLSHLMDAETWMDATKAVELGFADEIMQRPGTAEDVEAPTVSMLYEAAKAELERLQKERTLRSQQDKAMALFIRTLKKQPEVLDAWDDTVWTVMVEKAIVHRDGTITFVFYNGTEIAVERQAA